MRKIKWLVYIILLLSSLFALGYFAFLQTTKVKRDTSSLFNQYYRLKHTSPWQAKEALLLILEQEPNNITAIRALTYFYLQQGQTNEALKFLEKNQKDFPHDLIINKELAKLYVVINMPGKAKSLIEQIKETSPELASKLKQLHIDIPDNEKIEVTKKSLYKSYIPSLHFIPKKELKILMKHGRQIAAFSHEKAKNHFNMLKKLSPHSADIHAELGYIALKQNQKLIAIKHLTNAFKLEMRPEHAAQLAYLHAEEKHYQQALDYFNYCINQCNPTLKSQSVLAVDYLKRTIHQKMNLISFIPKPLSKKMQLLTDFYEYKKTNPNRAWNIIKNLIALYPDDVRIWKEAAHFATNQNEKELAIEYWRRAYYLEPKAKYALSIAYLYDGLGQKPQAYFYFNLATRTIDNKTRLKAEMAMTGLGGTQTQWLPKPFFTEIYGAPFYFSRFDLGVLPIIVRSGVVLEESHHLEAYLSYRRTQDNRSGTVFNVFAQAPISQIFDDNVGIMAIGFRAYPWRELPVQAFIEVGRAQDLIYRQRPKWRGDLRGGFVFFNRWGMSNTYTDNLTFPLRFVSTMYADVIYYSRYDNNIIGASFLRPGIRVATYHAASLDLYMANYLIMDKNHDFFNNVYSVGPGVAFQPTNRFNFVIRYESLNGFYLPANSRSPNPFRPTFYNNVVLLEIFSRF